MNLTADTATATKIRAKLGRRLKTADYDALMEQPTVGDAVAYLKHHTGYRELFSNTNAAQIRRGQVETLLNKTIKRDFISLLKFNVSESRRFLRLFAIRDEIEKLKLLLRLLNSHHTENFAQDTNENLKKLRTVDFPSLAKANDFASFIELLRPTPYYKVLAPFIHNEDQQDVFNLEMALDMYYSRLSIALMEKALRGKDKEIIAQTLGSETDIKNITLILRLKKYYNFPSEGIYPYIIPNYYKIRESHIRALAESKSYEEAIEIVNRTVYKDALNIEDKFMEESLNEFIGNLHRKMFKANPYTISAPVSYIHLKEIEVRNIVKIIEGIRYKMPANEIKKHIVGYNWR